MADNMITLTIDGHEVQVEPGSTIMQAAKKLEVEIPHFCYHPRLSVAGNCRMCLVEVEGAPKPVASCAFPVSEGMNVKTQSQLAEQAHKNVMEMLLINHPLDCPICDQGGECDLQDIAVGYGSDRSRYGSCSKRSVEDKDIGPLVKTVMTRCIHCTRCVRFATEVAGVEEFGATFRGQDMKIGTYVEKALDSELSGNMIDLCPVGALTNKPFAFSARPWEMKTVNLIDVMDGMGTNIYADVRDEEVMRMRPRTNEEINEEWMTDTARFSVDGLTKNRLTAPLVREGKNLRQVSWQKAFDTLTEHLKGKRRDGIFALASSTLSAEDYYSFNMFMKESVGTDNVDARTDGSPIRGDVRASYVMNSGIAAVDNADAVLLIGCDLRRESPLLNARVRKNVLAKNIKVASIGALTNTTYDVKDLGRSPMDILDLIEDEKLFKKTFPNTKNLMVIMGAEATTRTDALKIMGAVRKLCQKYEMIRPDWNGYNLLSLKAGQVAALDFSVYPVAAGVEAKDISKSVSDGLVKTLFIYGDVEIPAQELQDAEYIVYMGTHHSAYADIADVVLPTAAYTEKEALWVNTEGRVQAARKAVNPPMQAKEDWKIFRALSECLGKKLPFDTLSQLRLLIAKVNDAYLPENWGSFVVPAWDKFGLTTKPNKAEFEFSVPEYYLSNGYLRQSKVMQDCAAKAQDTNNKKVS